MSGILDGIRVVDMSRYISGPYCAMMLADMGAEVIKVEKPGEGEIYRVGGPWKDGVSLVFQAMNRNKKSVTADTRSPEGLQLIKELILHSDVLIENFRAGVMEKMGLGYEELHKLNPRLIMVSITGFGHSGPLRDRMAFDGIISAMSGVTRIDGDKVERSKGAIHDHMAGMNAVIGTLLALLDREKTGKGQYVDTAMIACSTVLRSDSIADAYLNGDEAAMGSDDAAPYGYLKTKDDWVNFQAGTNQLFRKLRTICPEPVVQEERWLDDLPYPCNHGNLPCRYVMDRLKGKKVQRDQQGLYDSCQAGKHAAGCRFVPWLASGQWCRSRRCTVWCTLWYWRAMVWRRRSVILCVICTGHV